MREPELPRQKSAGFRMEPETQALSFFGDWQTVWEWF